MSGPPSQRFVVAGAGAVGSAIALCLQSGGASVVLVDPAAPADNASGVAAGMLAPAFETHLDETSRGRFPLLKAARDAWPRFLEMLEAQAAPLERSGALWVGDEASQAAALASFEAMGAEASLLSSVEATRLSPGLRAPAGAVFTPEDWRLDAPAMLKAMREAFVARGGEVRSGGVRSAREGRVVLGDGVSIEADAVVLATGLAPQGMEDAPLETRRLEPIKGQILRFDGAGPRTGPAVRAKGIYVAPSASGAAVGATMEQGISDRAVDPEVAERFRGLATALFPDLASAAVAVQAGVRASSPDGLPIVGRSSVPGLWLALGARRNGWLLAPLIAETISAGLAGRPTGPWSAPFDPLRFGPNPPG